VINLNGNDYIILQVHGGCDARGGYTKPRVFSLDYEGRDGFVLASQRAWFSCSNKECDKTLDIDYCSITVLDGDGNELESPQDIEDIAACECGGTWTS
jgi:hypothetical protein